jgi:hypothetical protein
MTAMHHERGQTLPFWVMGILTSLTLAFFISNYANTVKYQIHAQNAADSAAAAALSQDAAALNTTQTLLAALDLQTLKVQDAESALPYILGTTPCGPSNLLSDNCTSALGNAVTDIASANTQLASLANTLNDFQKNLGGTLTDVNENASGSVNSLFSPTATGSCTIAIMTDCDFKYTTFVSYGSTGIMTVDEFACKKVPNVAASFLHLSQKNSAFYAIGHTTSTLAPLSTAYNPATLGSAFATTAQLFPDIAGNALVGNLSGININSNLFVVTGAPAPATPRNLTDVCPT